MKHSVILLSVILMGSCEFMDKHFKLGDEKGVPKVAGVTYYEDGTIKSKCQADENNKRHGTCYNYYPNGNLKTTIFYEHGEQLRAIQHYKTGVKALEIYYKGGEKNGRRIRYYEDESIASEVEYKNGNPGLGLREFDEDGQLIENYPELAFNVIDRIENEGRYIIEVYFTTNPHRGEYYLGELDDGKFAGGINLGKLSKEGKRGRYTIFLPVGMFRMEKLNFVGVYKTSRGNPYVTQKTFNLAIDNP